VASKKYCGREASVYLPSEELLARWKQEAKQYGLSISDYIFEMTERGRRAGQDDASPNLARENGELKSRCLRLEGELRLLKTSLENAQTEIYKMRFSSFHKPDEPGFSEYDKDLIALLRRGGLRGTQELLSGLGIDPRDSQVVRLVSMQLEELKRFGLVKEVHNGWRWVD
jgi:hypothetical protein